MPSPLMLLTFLNLTPVSELPIASSIASASDEAALAQEEVVVITEVIVGNTSYETYYYRNDYENGTDYGNEIEYNIQLPP